MIHYKLRQKIALAVLVCFTSLTGAQPLYAVPMNTQLPTGFNSVMQNSQQSITGTVMDVTQTGQTSVNKWENFSIGADATVNFSRNGGGEFNSVNFVNSGAVSEIYGQLNAIGGNIFIANTAGVQIGNSAQINVGSIYLTNKDLENAGIAADMDRSAIAAEIARLNHTTNAELMSLGGIVSAGNVTFDGDRIVIDADRLYSNLDGAPLGTAENLTIKTTNTDNVVIGYTAGYDSEQLSFTNVNKKIDAAADSTAGSFRGYAWVKNLTQLQAMNSVKDDDGNLDGWFALRNSIDANFTYDPGYWYAAGKNGSDVEKAKGFKPIGDTANKFTGRFDGLGFDIFDLNVNRVGEDYAGLFGYAENAVIRDFTLNSGLIRGGSNTGAAVGYASGGRIENVINAANVEGADNVGGVAGYAVGAENARISLSSLVNIGTVNGGSNVGGVAGAVEYASLLGETFNRGAVTGSSSGVGGVAGSAVNSTIGNVAAGDETPFVIYNQLDVTGGWNVGGIAGSISGTEVQNVANYGTVLATSSAQENYSYHTARGHDTASDVRGTTYDGNTGVASIGVLAANVGGVVGRSEGTSAIRSAENKGDVTTSTTEGGADVGTYYNAGNVGGIAGHAEDTTISDVMNKENAVAGAHNVGGVAGYMAGASTIDAGINNGGEITATGARRADGLGFAQESVRSDGSEIFNIGNIGGVAGYMYGDETYVSNSANRGTVHSAYIKDQNNVLPVSKAANAGGIAGKIDRSKTADTDSIKGGLVKAAVSGSYNTGNVQGYTGVGGVAGFMYNGEITRSYNLGGVAAARKADNTTEQALNMGGVVGDTTEGTDARALVYDVYNAGAIGDPMYNVYGRHVGGVVGRLSGAVEKAYNTGDIYNGSNVVGGIAGWWYAGTITDTFNTGNITVLNSNTALSQVGGIVGAVNLYPDPKTLSYSYNLGTLRSFRSGNLAGENSVGGIIGDVYAYGGAAQNLDIDNVYTAGHLYAATEDLSGGYTSGGAAGLGAIVGRYGDNGQYRSRVGLSNTNYITPGASDFTAVGNSDANRTVQYSNRSDAYSYLLTGLNKMDAGTNFSVAGTGWRIYDGGTPILNSFTPYAEQFFSSAANRTGLTSVQYGTAYNPLLTIINSDKMDLRYNWSDLGVTGAAGLVVYGNGSLTLDDFASGGPNNYFGGTIYSDGALSINGTGSNFNLGSASRLYGSSAALDAKDGGATIYGSVSSTNGGITVKGGDVEIIGRLNAAALGGTTTISGISPQPKTIDTRNLNDPYEQMQSVTERFTHTTDAAAVDGGITVNADGAVELLYGHLRSGEVSAGGDIAITGDSIYIDTVFRNLGGDMDLTGNRETLLDLSNMGDLGNDVLHGEFLDHFKNGGNIRLNGSGSKILALDMWDYKVGAFNLSKYDVDDQHKLADDVKAMNVYDNGKRQADGGSSYSHIWISGAGQLKGIQTYYNDHKSDNPPTGILGYNFVLKNDIEASGINGYEAIGAGSADGFTGTFNGRGYAISGLMVGEKSDTGGSAAGTPSAAAIFDTVGVTGTVKNLGLYSSTFYGKDYAAGIAGKNYGEITGISTLGNHVEVFGSDGSMILKVNDAGGSTIDKRVGAAGGIAGYNAGTVAGVTVSDSVIAGDKDGINSTGGLDAEILTTAGGIAGVNEGMIGGGGEGDGVTADSAVAANKDTTYSLGGVAGVNKINETDVNKAGMILNAYNTGVTHGEYGDSNITSNSVGGIAGINTGSIKDAYNGSDVTGGSYVGGITGYNHTLKENGSAVEGSGILSNAVNTGDILSNFTRNDDSYYEYTGGIAGYNAGTINGGRNAGRISGGNYVGGMVGGNAKEVTLVNLANSVFAAITGEQYVGGIAGSNAGDVRGSDNLNNYGKIFGQEFVGGIAGLNDGTIENTNTDMTLYVKDDTEAAQFFGGVAGQNKGTITNASNKGDVTAAGASFVGGIVGMNGEESEESKGNLTGEIINEGNVVGEEKVGGIAGTNKNNLLLARDEDTKLKLSNSGSVTAANGGAGGIFYENTDRMSWVELVNSGTVNGGSQTNAGGIFGVNSGNAVNSAFVNSGTVTGAGNAGGIFGSNSGTFTNSSLVGTVSSKVTGTGNNVGGLIGYNIGSITGGRDENNEYYKYLVYNNGLVEGAGNAGGLIGYNGADGNLSAAYNTGAVTGSDSNIGGVAGYNAGTVSAVFNTIMTLNENKDIIPGVVAGGAKVGGLVGYNAGTLSDAYNTTGVTGAIAAGNAVGENAAGGIVSNVYATNTGGMLMAANGGTVSNAYSYAAGDTSVGGVTVIGEAERKLSASYGGFIFDGDNPVWKAYEGLDDSLTFRGYSAPLLKVFLTKAEYDGGKEKLVYNAGEQKASIDFVAAADGKAAYSNVNSLLTAIGNTNAGDGYIAFWSRQIDGSKNADGTLNPNNLGYDIDAAYSIGRATLGAELKDVWRVYGNEQMYGDESLKNKLGDYSGLYSLGAVAGTGTALNDAMLAELNDGVILKKLNDGAVDNLNPSTHRTTNDAGDYAWTAEATLGDSVRRNYQFDAAGAENVTLAGNGKSHVKKADLNIALSSVSRVYGDAGLSVGYAYGIAEDKTTGTTNGDKLSFNEKYNVASDNDGAIYLDADTGEIRTNNSGSYLWRVTEKEYADAFSGINIENYNVRVDDGLSEVTPKHVGIKELIAKIVYGDQDGGGLTVAEEAALAEGSIAYGDNISLGGAAAYSYVTGSGYERNKGSRTTADVGLYEDSLGVSGLILTGDDEKKATTYWMQRAPSEASKLRRLNLQ